MPVIEVRKRERATFTPSSYQAEIFKEVSSGTDNLLIEAVAGSGKTTTIVQALELIPTDKKVLFLAFNKAIADSLCGKIPFHVEAKTFHSLGFATIRANSKYVKGSPKKAHNILRYNILGELKAEADKEFYFENQREILRLVSNCKGAGIWNFTQDMWETIQEEGDCDIPKTHHAYTVIRSLLIKSLEFTGEKGACIVDFDDMLAVPIKQGMEFPQYDYVFVDEAQDLNYIQRAMLYRVLKPINFGDDGGRLIAVGDTAQAIYGFRGADHNSMSLLREAFTCKELPLSISYRCPKAVVAQAKIDCDRIEASSTAEEGEVHHLTRPEHAPYYTQGAYVLCRTWAPLIKEAMALTKSGFNICVLGRDLTPSLVKLAKQIPPSINQAITEQDIFAYKRQLHVDLSEKWQRKKLAYKLEQCDVLKYLVADESLTAKQIQAALTEIMSDRPIEDGITLTTIHRAKGLEADDIFLLYPEQIPHYLAEGEDEIQQEYNLRYVAVTRAKKRLFMVMGNEK